MDKTLNLKQSYLDIRKISNACALETCQQHYNIYALGKIKPVPDIKIESYILALFLNNTFDLEKIMQNAEQGQMVPSI